VVLSHADTAFSTHGRSLETGLSACEGLLSVDPKESAALLCWSEPSATLSSKGLKLLGLIKGRLVRGKSEAPEPCKKLQAFAVCQGRLPVYFKAMAVRAEISMEVHGSDLCMERQ
jgi:hypothetical protein